MLPLTFWLMFLLYNSAREGVRELLPLLLGTGEGPLRLLVLPPPVVLLLSEMLWKGLLPPLAFPGGAGAGGRGGREGG